ncbi:FecCD family ABC transporter permease [Paenibacillus durus]|uniref:FecCD family ABC transporter permease n=1 Tax=Paenibacillus durus TaxID=44251 RepID=UPI000472C93E|nr:iron ABC transporter permease [Paenibacillus durus]
MEYVKKGVIESSDVLLKSDSRRTSSRKKASILTVLAAVLIAVICISVTVGRYSVPLSEMMHILWGKLFGVTPTWPLSVETVLLHVRIPRIIKALLVGGALAVSGAAYQGLFKNPMVSPDILGVSSGAGFGASLAILFSYGTIGIQLAAFGFGLGAVMLTFFISAIIGRGKSSILVLVLTGMVISTLFSSLTSMTKYLADTENKLPDITYWLMGSLARSTSLKDIIILLVPVLVGSIPLFLIRWKLNVLSFGEEEAQALGINTKRLRLLIIGCATLLTASAISVSGMVGWIGLIIPHAARLIAGPNYKMLLPTSILIGSAFLLLVDDIARSAFALEIPLSILTSLIGAPFFLYLLLQGRKAWI